MSASLNALATCAVHWSLLRARLDACVAVVQPMQWCRGAIELPDIGALAASFVSR